jgi:hypothetical protein
VNLLDLQSRVTDFVRQHPGLTLNDVARGVRARTADVADVLASEAFYASPRESYASDRAQVYRLAPAAGEKTGRAARRSQCSLIAEVLADGGWHTTSEIHRRCGFSRLNSRIAEMRSTHRRWGMVIECRHIEGVQAGPDAQEYRFVGYKAGFGPEASEAADCATLAGPGSAASDASGDHADAVIQASERREAA